MREGQRGWGLGYGGKLFFYDLPEKCGKAIDNIRREPTRVKFEFGKLASLP